MAKTTRQTAIFGVEDWKRIYQTYREADFQSYDFETLRKSFMQQELEVMEDLKADFELEKKSNGQRLRNILYKLFEQDKEGFLTFTKYYDHQMERFTQCNHKPPVL